MTVGFIKAFNKSILLGLAGLDKLKLNALSFTPTHKDVGA
jgi:hypothetical protein